MASLSTVSLTGKPTELRAFETKIRPWMQMNSEMRPSLTPLVFSQRIEGSRKLVFVCAASKRAGKKNAQLVDDSLGDDEEEEYVRPVLPGDEPDFWEGPQWDLLGFIVKYLWAIGIVVALVGCLVAVRYYNEGASDFRETEVFKEAMGSQGIPGTPSESQIFDESTSKEAPIVGEESSTQ